MFRTRGSSIEAPGAGSVAWVAKGNKIIFDFVYLCPSTVPCLRGRVVRPTTRQFQKLHVRVAHHQAVARQRQKLVADFGVTMHIPRLRPRYQEGAFCAHANPLFAGFSHGT